MTTRKLLYLRRIKDRLTDWLMDPKNLSRARKSNKFARLMLEKRELRNHIEAICRAANPNWAESV